MYTIIKDRSPYYITFTFPGLPDIIDYVSKQTPESVNWFAKYYSHDLLSLEAAKVVSSMLPMRDKVQSPTTGESGFNLNRMAIFSTPPGGGGGIHKDGIGNRVSFNIPIQILDDTCITCWYDDPALDGLMPKENNNYAARAVVPYDKFRFVMKDYTPVETMIAKPNEMILFNTEIFHSWTNINSLHTRRILTIRPKDNLTTFFDDAKKFLFE